MEHYIEIENNILNNIAESIINAIEWKITKIKIDNWIYPFFIDNWDLKIHQYYELDYLGYNLTNIDFLRNVKPYEYFIIEEDKIKLLKSSGYNHDILPSIIEDILSSSLNIKLKLNYIKKDISFLEKAKYNLEKNNIEDLKEYTTSHEYFKELEKHYPEYEWLFLQIFDKLINSDDLNFDEAINLLWYSWYKSKVSKYLLKHFSDYPEAMKQIIWHARWKVVEEALENLNRYFRENWEDEISLEKALYYYKD